MFTKSSKAKASLIAKDSDMPKLSLEEAKALAQHMFSKKNRERAKQKSYETILNKRKIEKRWKARQGASRRNARRYFEHSDEPLSIKIHIKKSKPKKQRCWDWVVHHGDVHYACNGASFTDYTKVDAYVYNATNPGDPIKALGIGTVKINAMRAMDSDNVCEITLHNVLHLPSMPCNGISQALLEASD
ncbi:hypothetical protein HII31_06506 [Pseudocercospora fuligena]|uniref:Retrovirus-related Pol polyprotein from transposon TNT 1-94-like beta-barrel domain-containing protein n=1 Tax=Pseudocercospora fuligena TaxID=685502 RepID=A0A8H6RHW3_9PEZI|nr:hypothetical protein HII31_06506 [Pseudocercospora fuligena]